MSYFSTLDFFGNEAVPQHMFRTKADTLPNGAYEFEIVDATLDRINADDVCRLGLRTGGATFEHVHWLNKQPGVNGFLAEMAALGFPSNTWGNRPGQTPLSQAIPDCVCQLPGKRFHAIKSSRQSNDTPPKTYHEVRATGVVGGRSMPGLTPPASSIPSPAPAPVAAPAPTYSTNDVPF